MKDFYQNSPCPICGKCEYSWGQLHADVLGYISQSDSVLKQFFGRTGKMKARHCDVCGNVQIFTRDEVEENQ